MQCKPFTLLLGEDQDLENLNAFLGQVAPIQVSSSLVQSNPPFWSVLVLFGGDAPPSTIVPLKAKSALSAKPEKVLESSNSTAFEALRQWGTCVIRMCRKVRHRFGQS
jgi:hypothetical protein